MRLYSLNNNNFVKVNLPIDYFKENDLCKESIKRTAKYISKE